MRQRPDYAFCFSAFLKVAGVIAAAMLSYVVSRHSVDFLVYRATAHAMLTRVAPIYGPKSGLTWPLVYRYPPLFLLLFVPFALLPAGLAVFIWTALKFVVLYFLARALFSGREFDKPAWVQCLAVFAALPYLLVEFHYGNAQFFVFAMVAAALLWTDERPVLAALTLALGISLKVWPLFFVPYLVARRHARVAGLALVFAAGLALVPAGYFGWLGNAALLGEWAKQEFGVASAAGEPAIIGFPSQSLHSVLLRYLSALDYSKLPDPNYPKVNLLALNPRGVQLLWAIFVALGYAGLLLLARHTGATDLTVHALAFCDLALLEPFTQRTDLVVLFWPIMIAAAALYRDDSLSRWARAAIWAALSVIVLQPSVPTAAMQRSLHVLGVDFAASCLLGVGLLGKYLQESERNAPDSGFRKTIQTASEG
jgi:Glycosyltransferase family 87